MYLFGVDDDDVVVGVNVWSVFRFVFVMQVVGNFGCQMIQGLVGSVDDELVVLYSFWFCGIGFYLLQFQGLFENKMVNFIGQWLF